MTSLKPHLQLALETSVLMSMATEAPVAFTCGRAATARQQVCVFESQAESCPSKLAMLMVAVAEPRASVITLLLDQVEVSQRKTQAITCSSQWGNVTPAERVACKLELQSQIPKSVQSPHVYDAAGVSWMSEVPEAIPTDLETSCRPELGSSEQVFDDWIQLVAQLVQVFSVTPVHWPGAHMSEHIGPALTLIRIKAAIRKRCGAVDILIESFNFINIQSTLRNAPLILRPQLYSPRQRKSDKDQQNYQFLFCNSSISGYNHHGSRMLRPLIYPICLQLPHHHKWAVGKIGFVSQFPHLSFLPQIEQLQNYNIQAMEVLVEPHKISQEVLLKVAAGIISKYEVHEINNIFSFVQDSNQAIQEMKLYSHTLSQLYLETGKEATQLFAYYHTQIFRIVDFLLKTVQKIYNKNQVRSSPAYQAMHCFNCQHLIHQRNVRNMQREILDYHRYSAQMLDQDLKWEQQQDNGLEEETAICSESYFRKKMLVIQKNIEDRQNNILECIQDFQQLRSNLMGEMQRRQSVGDVSAFNMREHLQAVSQHFMVTLRKVELRINTLRRQNPANEEKGVQTASNNEEIVKVAPVVDPLKMSMRSQADFKKVSNLNSKLQETSKKGQSQINSLTAKVEVLESQNKKLREEVFTLKMKNCIERSTKNVDNLQQKTKRQESQKHKKTLLIDNLQSIFCESAEFGCQFTTTLQQNFNGKDLSLTKQEDALPMIKSIFQKTLEKYTNRKSSMLVSLEKKRSLKDEEVVELKRNRSKKKSIKMQMQTQGKETSRFSLRKTKKKELQVTTAFSLKLTGEKNQYSMSSITKSSIKNTLKDTAHPYNQSHKIKKLAKLSIFSDLKQQPQQPKPATNPAPKLRQKTDYSPQQLSEHYLAPNLASSKVFKKSTFRRNKSQEDLTPAPNKQQSYHVIKLKEKEIEVKVVRSFLLLSDQFGRAREKQNKLNIGERSKHILEEQDDVKIQRQKIVLTLDELNYLTLLFSLLARVHLANLNVYTQIKEWILSSPKVKNLQEKSQSLIMRKTVSEIISRHRQCTSSPALCHHLTDFLEAIQRFLTYSELDAVERAKNTLIQ